MLAMTHYGRAYIDDARARIDAQVAAYRALAAAGAEASAAADPAVREAYEAAATAFEPVWFTSLVQVLENFFVHRQRGLEGKDGNALNEVRVLCSSLTGNGGRLAADKQIKLKPETSVLGYAVGDEIRVTEADFLRLAQAYFEQIEAKFL